MLQEGLEPPTLGLLDPCSTKLSYQSCAAHARDRTKDLQIFSLTLSQLSYMGVHSSNTHLRLLLFGRRLIDEVHNL